MEIDEKKTSLSVDLEDGGGQCQVILFGRLENASEIRQMIMKGRVEASLVRAELVVDPFQVIVAANKAARSLAAKKMVTRSVYSEILFNLSPSKNITESLKTFGLGDGDSETLAVVLDGESGDKTKKLRTQIRGTEKPLEELSLLTNETRVKEIYKVTEDELSVGTLLDAVVSRIACKDFFIL